MTNIIKSQPSCIWECSTVGEGKQRKLSHCLKCYRHMGFIGTYIKCRCVYDDCTLLEAPLYNLIDSNSENNS